MSSMISTFLQSDTVSLNHVWTSSSPIFPLNPPYHIEQAYNHSASFGSLPANLSSFAVSMTFSGQHGGPTLDALGHMAQNKVLFDGSSIADVEGPEGLLKLGIEEYPEDKYMNRGVLVDLPYCMDMDILPEGYIVSEKDVTECLDKEEVEIMAGDSVLIRSGYGKYFKENPGFYVNNTSGNGADVADYLVQKGIFLTAADTMAWDSVLLPFPGHVKLIAKNGIYISENMNLEFLSAACQDKEIWEFILVMNPPKIKGAAAMAVNAFAIFPPTDTSGTEKVGSIQVILLATVLCMSFLV